MFSLIIHQRDHFISTPLIIKLKNFPPLRRSRCDSCGQAVNQIEHWEFSDTRPDDDLVEKASYQTSSVYGFGHPPFYENILDSLRGISSPVCDGREGLRSLELLIGAYRSAREKRSVNLPLEY